MTMHIFPCQSWKLKLGNERILGRAALQSDNFEMPPKM